MKILGIETSCDETAVSIIETNGVFPDGSIEILGNQLYSQIAVHAEFGGVFPMMAKREHQKNLVPLLIKCLEESRLKFHPTESDNGKIEKIDEILIREGELSSQFKEIFEYEKPDIDLIAVTSGPGLEPALWVGVSFAKALAELWNIPLMPINHMEGHIVVAGLNTLSEKNFEIKKIEFPSIALLISGGHTQLVLMKDYLQYEIIGNTKDDAIGEAFDKVARIMDLPYPGGPEISKLAEKERIEFPNKKTQYPQPRPMIHSHDLHFSFSGLKTSILYLTQKIENISKEIKQEIAKEFEDAVTEVIVKKTKEAVEQYGAKNLVIGGGVSANKNIRNEFKKLCEDLNISLLLPEISASTDNAFMIALAGYINISLGKKTKNDLKANGNLSL